MRKDPKKWRKSVFPWKTKEKSKRKEIRDRTREELVCLYQDVDEEVDEDAQLDDYIYLTRTRYASYMGFGEKALEQAAFAEFDHLLAVHGNKYPLNGQPRVRIKDNNKDRKSKSKKSIKRVKNI